MATKRVLSLTNTEAHLKVDGTVGAVTFSLATDLLSASEVLDGGTQNVMITGVQWAGANGGFITITRNGVNIAILNTVAAGSFTITSDSWLDNVNPTNDIVVTTSGAESQCWLRVRKQSGYKTKIEPEQFGQYDNPSASGS